LHYPSVDFVLFPPDQTDQSGVLGKDDVEDGDYLSFDSHGGLDAQVFIPWTSPGTRLRNNQTLLQHFNQAYDKPTDHHENILIDPRLSHAAGLGLDWPELVSSAQASHMAGDTKMLIDTHEVAGERPSLKRRREDASLDCHVAGIQSRPGNPSEAASNSLVETRQSLSGVSHGLRQRPVLRLAITKPEEDEDEDEDDEERPNKRPRPTKVDFKDTEMPDIFFSAYPHIYNRDQKPVYGSCHSLHKDISTLVYVISNPFYCSKFN
jgi:hypothetical protein